MKQNKTISSPKKGMNRDVHSSALEPMEYSFALNSNTEGETGEQSNQINEPSNNLTVDFPTGFKVIGKKKDLLANRTYFFLTNPDINFSSIGYVDDTQNTNNNFDEYIPCENCNNSYNELGTPLEETTQTPTHTYVEIINDSCNGDLNFNINFPIKFIELKDEKLGKSLYWTDFNNPPRKINLSDIDYYQYTGEVVCGVDNTVPTCIDVSKILMQPNYKIPKITPDVLQIGGNLKMGTYEFLIAYSDQAGNEISEYYSITNPISIFDENNRTLSQPELDAQTNFAIRLKVEDLDTNFSFYKVVVIEHTNLAQGESYYEEGVYPITNDSIFYASSSTPSQSNVFGSVVTPRVRTSLENILSVKSRFEKVKGLVSSNNYLFLWGLIPKKQPNLQPIVNLLGSFMKWQSSIAKEDIYKSAIATSKYKGYMRDEVQPFGIRFQSTDGSTTPVFPLIARPSEEGEKDEVDSEDKNLLSILDNTPNCTGNERNERWQLFNTATLEGVCPNDLLSGNTVIEDVEKTCTIDEVALISGTYTSGVLIVGEKYQIDVLEPGDDFSNVGYISIGVPFIATGTTPTVWTNGTSVTKILNLSINGGYTNLGDYINENYDEIINPSSELYEPELASYLTDTYPDIHCRPNFGTVLTSGSLVVGQQYLIEEVEVGDDFSNVGFVTEGELFIATETAPLVWTNNTLVVKTTCDSPVLQSSEVIVDSVEGEVSQLVEKEENDYLKSVPSDICVLFKRSETTPDILRNTTFETEYMSPSSVVYYRNGNFSNEICGYAPNILNNNDPSSTAVTYYNNPHGGNIFTDVLTTKPVTIVDKQETITFLGTSGTCNVIINAVSYSASFSVDLATTTANFFATHQTAIETSTGGILTLSSGKIILTNAVNGAITAITNTSGDLAGYIGKEGFFEFLSKGALWYKIPVNGRGKIVFEIVKNTLCTQTDDIPSINKLRYSFYATCGSSTPLFSYIVDTTVGDLRVVDLTGYPTTEFFVVVDAPISTDLVDAPTLKVGYRSAPPCGCYALFTRDIEYISADVTFTSISLEKRETYVASCEFVLPEANECDPVPYQYGKFAYWESTETYPDNQELYDSSSLTITAEDLENLTEEQINLFDLYFKESEEEGVYILKNTTDFRCKPIRHYKFPNNQISPFMVDVNVRPFSDSVVFPLGASLDSNVVNVFLDLAVKNNLLSQNQRDNISGYEILKANNIIHKSIIAKTVGFDMYKYTEANREVYYPNYPFNDLGDDLLHTQGGSLISHPFGAEKNNKFSLLSPDLLYIRPALPTEIIIDGFQLGNTRGYFNDVDDHSKWVILGSQAKNLASTLAAAEVALEILIQTSNLLVQQDMWITAGVSGGTNAAGFAIRLAAILAYSAGVVTSIFVHQGQYRYQWLKTFYDLGSPKNFASYYVAEGFHNKFLKNEDESNYLRGLNIKKYIKSGRFTVTDEKAGTAIKINNFGREQSAFISLGEDHFIEYPQDIVGYDNNTLDDSTGSRTIASQNGCPGGYSDEIVRNSAVPYITLKNYIPNQFGKIDSLQWLTTGYTKKLIDNSDCDVIYGGTVTISRDWQHRKLPIFRTTAINQADKLAFAYSLHPNIASPRFYVDYLVDTGETTVRGALFPDIASDTQFDCSNSKFYYNKPSKFYLQYHGFVSYLVESEINCNFRYGRTDIKDQFYPEYGDMLQFTQETTRTIFTPNSYFYNSVYSRPVTQTPFLTLPNTYSKEVWDKKDDAENGVVYSLQDSSENDLVDPWLIYRPLDRYEFPKKYGKLIQLKDLESATILGRFENQMVLFNAVDNLANELSPSAVEIGTGGIFTKRPIDFKSTDLGFAGTQNYEMVSTPFGHFSVDAKRGKIFMLDQTGRDLQPISDFIGGKPSGMKNWFREHLPFKILKTFPELDIDNHYKGVGITMGWDARFDRVFITKKDYLPKNECITLEEGEFYNNCPTCETDNLVTNGNFDTNLDGWDSQYENQYLWNNGKAWFNGANDENPHLQQDILQVGKTYRIKLDISINEECNLLKYVRVYAGATFSDFYTSNGNSSIDIELTCTGNTIFKIESAFICGYEDPFSTISIDNVCVVATEPKKIEITDANYFEDVSWTIAYKVTEGSWLSYYSFTPDYYTAHHDYFQTGYNFKGGKSSLWSHLLNNNSFQVFNGVLEPWIVEIPIQNQNVSKTLSSIELHLEAKRWQNQWDFSQHKGIGFNKATIYNTTNNSGILNLIEQKSLQDIAKYPKTNLDGSQDILFTAQDEKQRFNYFYNRVKKETNNIPIWLWDKNRINSRINPKAVSFYNKGLLERLKGDSFLVRLTQDKESRYQMILKLQTNTEIIQE